MAELHDYELSERVSILKRLREALLAQRDKFRKYLEVLDHLERDILEHDTEKLEAHVELEQAIMREIYAVQKVIDPLTDVYRMAYPTRETEIPEIERSLEALRDRVMERNRENRELLRDHVVVMRRKISDLRANRPNRPAFRSAPMPSLVDVST